MDLQNNINLDAKKILLINDKGNYTIPTDGLYPFQWNWDSAFAAYGFAQFDVIRPIIWGQTDVAWWYKQNAFLYIHSNANQRIKFDKCVIATGSKPATLPFINIDKHRIITSTEALSLSEIPKSTLG